MAELCLLCNKKLIEFKKEDWKARKYHKTCYKLKEEKQQIQNMIDFR